MCLISQKAAIDAAKHAWAKGLEPSQYIEIIPSFPAVPLEPLCEWLADNAYMYLSEEEMDNGWSSSDPVYWEMKLSKWMEAQDAR